MQTGMAHLWKEDTHTQSSSQQEEHVLAQTLNATRLVKRVLAPTRGMQLVTSSPPNFAVSNHHVVISPNLPLPYILIMDLCNAGFSCSNGGDRHFGAET